MAEQLFDSQLSIDLAISDVVVGALRRKANLNINQNVRNSAAFLSKMFNRQLMNSNLEEILTEEFISVQEMRNQLRETLSSIPKVGEPTFFRNTDLIRRLVTLLSALSENNLSDSHASELASSLLQLCSTEERIDQVA